VSLLGLPAWLLAGVALGAVFAVAITAAFLAGERLVPDAAGDDHEGRQRGEEMRREEIRYYLEAIGETFETDAAVADHTVAFFLPEREVAVTFDARTYLSLRDSEVYAILVEHEMPGVHLGYRLPFETPTVGPDFGDEPRNDAGRGPAFGVGPGGNEQQWQGGDPRPSGVEGDTVEPSFAVLGLPPDATSEEVRSAYRDRVKEVHPDHGGDEDSFRRIQEAYATAREHAD
jgi:hypothetical protein